MQQDLTAAIQDYLKAIHALTLGGGEASTSELALRLGVAPASVTGMLQRLAAAKKPMVRYHKHRGASLTPVGKRAALEVVRHHRLLEEYLVKALGYPWDAVHAEADRLEHVISEEFETRIDDLLGHPRRDPHGEPIPAADLSLPPDDSVPLSSLEPDQEASLVCVRADDPALLRYLQQIHLTPGATIKALHFSPLDQNLEIQIADQNRSVVLGPAITGKIFIHPRPE